METQHLSELTDQELLLEAKKVRNANILNAFLIGFLAGILVFSFLKSTLGLLSLIPLFLIYKLVNKPADHKNEVERLLKERNLK